MNNFPLRCVDCEYVANGSQALKKHYASEHPAKLQLKCAHVGCNYATDRPSNLQRHIENCKKPRYQCAEEGCPFTTQSTIQFNRHVANEHPAAKGKAKPPVTDKDAGQSSPSTVSLAPSTDTLFNSPKRVDLVNDPIFQSIQKITTDDSVLQQAATTAGILPPATKSRRVVTMGDKDNHELTIRTTNSIVTASAELPDPRAFRGFDGTKVSDELGRTLSAFRELAQTLPCRHQLRRRQENPLFETIYEWVELPSGARFGQTTRRWKMPGSAAWETDTVYPERQPVVPDCVLPPTSARTAED